MDILALLFLAFGVLMGVAAGLFWLWMLISCLRSHSENKVVWVLVMLAMNAFGALLYWLIEYRKVPAVAQDAT